MEKFIELDIQAQYDVICSYFRTTTELYDEIEWDGKVCSIVLSNETIESYTKSDLQEIMKVRG